MVRFVGVNRVLGSLGGPVDPGDQGDPGGPGGVGGPETAILLDGYDTMGIGYIALWGFRAKCWSGVEWSGWTGLDTP